MSLIQAYDRVLSHMQEVTDLMQKTGAMITDESVPIETRDALKTEYLRLRKTFANLTRIANDILRQAGINEDQP